MVAFLEWLDFASLRRAARWFLSTRSLAELVCGCPPPVTTLQQLQTLPKNMSRLCSYVPFEPGAFRGLRYLKFRSAQPLLSALHLPPGLVELQFSYLEYRYSTRWPLALVAGPHLKKLSLAKCALSCIPPSVIRLRLKSTAVDSPLPSSVQWLHVHCSVMPKYSQALERLEVVNPPARFQFLPQLGELFAVQVLCLSQTFVPVIMTLPEVCKQLTLLNVWNETIRITGSKSLVVHVDYCTNLKSLSVSQVHCVTVSEVRARDVFFTVQCRNVQQVNLRGLSAFVGSRWLTVTLHGCTSYQEPVLEPAILPQPNAPWLY